MNEASPRSVSSLTNSVTIRPVEAVGGLMRSMNGFGFSAKMWAYGISVGRYLARVGCSRISDVRMLWSSLSVEVEVRIRTALLVS